MESTLWSAAGILTAGAITPGPNTLVVLREATRRGRRAAMTMSLGVVAGGLVLLMLAAAGVGTLLQARPALEDAVTCLGAAYLVYLGCRLALGPEPGEEHGRALPTSAWGLFAFQFLNPKAWVLVITVTAAAQAGLGQAAALAPLAGLYVVIPTASLGIWIWAGSKLGDRLRSGTPKALFDRAMGVLLTLCAAMLLAGVAK